MKLLQALIPLNIHEEREKFLSSDSYNPKFEYAELVPATILTKYGYPKEEIYKHCVEQCKVLLAESTIRTELPQATEQEIVNKINETFSEMGIANPLEIRFSSDIVSKCILQGNTISFKSPIIYKPDEIQGVIHHEINTHWLRIRNNALQPWAQKDRPDILFRRTEEGMAILHTYLGAPNQSLFQTFSLYIALYLSQHQSFREVYSTMLRIGVSPKRAWRICVRAKRGLTDTSRPGGFTKDIVYLEGAVLVSNWIAQKTSNPKDLYLGRIAISELKERTAEANTKDILLPPFLRDLNDYRSKIKAIARKGGFERVSYAE